MSPGLRVLGLPLMNAAILSIGEELTSGQCVDTNSAWLSRSLTARGITVTRHLTVADDLESIADAFRQSMVGAELVIATGGLGPTPDDLTRDALALALGVPLEHSAEGEAQIRAFFARWGRTMNESNLVQAKVPHGCAILENTKGTAPGILKVGANGRVFALPGVPPEMHEMFERHVVPVLAGVGPVTLNASLRCFGLAEADLGQRLADLMVRDRNPLVGVTASGAVLTVRVKATGCSENEARATLDSDLSAIRERIGDCVFGSGTDGLEHAVARLLRDSGLTVATGESCTGGLLAKRLTDVPGSSRYFRGGVVAYANEAKCRLLGVPPELINDHGSVSEPVARSLAERSREVGGSDLGVGITGIAGPDGGEPPEKPVGLVYVGLATPDGCEVRRCCFGDHLTRCEIRVRAVNTGLNMLRLWLIRSMS